MNHPSVSKYTIEEYLATEENSLEKHEFYHGGIFSMAGASIQHNQIVKNVIFEAESHL